MSHEPSPVATRSGDEVARTSCVFCGGPIRRPLALAQSERDAAYVAAAVRLAEAYHAAYAALDLTFSVGEEFCRIEAACADALDAFNAAGEARVPKGECGETKGA